MWGNAGMNRNHAALATAITVVTTAAVGIGISGAASTTTIGRIGPSLNTTANGRVLTPAGRQTTVGQFPAGGALTPDGRFLWAVSLGMRSTPSEVVVVKVSDGTISQRLPLPGSTGNVAFSPDGTKAYVSGLSKGSTTPASTVKGVGGDVIHVFSIASNGTATEGDPIALPANPGGGQSMPNGLAVSPDGNKLAVALLKGNVCLSGAATCSSGTVPAAKVVILDISGGGAPAKSVGLDLGGLTRNVAFTTDSSKVLATDEVQGTLDVINASTGSWVKTGVGGPKTGDGTGDKYSHPGAIAVTPDGNYAYVAVANRDLIAKVNLSDLTVTWTGVGRSPAWGTQPVGLALRNNKLYVANSGEDAIAVLDVAGATPSLIGRIPTAAYPTAVSVTPDGSQIAWTAGKGYGTGPNGSPKPVVNYIPDMLTGRVGVLSTPSSSQLATYTAQADAAVHPSNFTTAPPNTALKSGGPIKHVFYIIRENRTYDQVLGDDKRGDGDSSLTTFGDNGFPGVAGGITPNVHALTRRFPLLDHFYSNSEVSVDGHLWVTQGTAIDTAQRRFQYSYSDRGYGDVDFILPPVFAPKVSLLDQAVRQNVSAANFGEVYAGSRGDDGRSTYAATKALEHTEYPMNMGCSVNPATDKTVTSPNLMNSRYCNSDSSANGLKLTAFGQKYYHSRFDLWNDWFQAQIKAKTLPSLTVIWLPNDHTGGHSVGDPTPQAMVADNDLGVGQIVQAISKSSVWKQSAIFSVEDDSQAGQDHVDGHRQIGLVISPWAKKAAVVHTRYDQDSMLRSVMILLGLQPLTLQDAFAQPMYDAFIRTTDKPDTTAYKAITPKYSTRTVFTAAQSRMAGNLGAKIPYGDLDAVPQPLFDQMIWRSIFGNSRPVPAPGPNSSQAELQRNAIALKALRAGKAIPFKGLDAEGEEED